MDALSTEDSARALALFLDLAREGRTTELLEFLDHGMPVDAQDGAGNTALMLAAYLGRLETVLALIERGADVDLRNARDQSPLAGAIFKGEETIVAALLAAGADAETGTPSARQTAEMFGTAHLLGPEPLGP